MNGPELRDIHLPEAVSWWPPAPGWWLLLGLLLLAAAAGWWWRRWRRSLRRRSLVEYRRLRAEFGAGLDRREALARLAALLRRVLIEYRGRRGYAASHGRQWLAQLRELGELDDEALGWFGEARYRPGPECDVERLFDAAEDWLGNLPAGESRVSA